MTVLSGSLRLGLGGADDASTTLLEPESFVALPARTVHLESAPEDVIVELHAHGPWTSETASPAR